MTTTRGAGKDGGLFAKRFSNSGPIFELSRVMGASVREIDRTYGHLVRESEDLIRARLNARRRESGAKLAFDAASTDDA